MMKKQPIPLIILSTFLFSTFIYANPQDKSQNIPQCRKTQNFQGCCSWHGGVAGCYNYRVVCNDKTYSPTCRCSVPYCVR